MVTQKEPLAHNVLSTGHQKVILQSDQEPSIIEVKYKAGSDIPTEIVYEESLVRDSQRQRKQRASQPNRPRTDPVQSTTTPTDRLVRDSSLVQCLVRHAAWTLATFRVGGDGMTAHQRIKGKPFNQQIAASGEQIQK